MYLLYVDESGDPGPNGSPYLILSGAAIFEGKWLYVERDLRCLIQRYFPTPPEPTEIHMAELRMGKGDFRTLSKPQRESLLQDYCDLANNMLPTELVLFSIIADKQHWFTCHPGRTGDDLYAEMFEQLSSRFDLFLRRRHAEGASSKGVIIADPHKEAMSDALKKNHRLHQMKGNRWNPLYNLVETIFFLDSHDSPGLQLADLAAYSVWRLVFASDDRIAKKIASLFDREPNSSRVNPGKWHGIKFLGIAPDVHARILDVWP